LPIGLFTPQAAALVLYSSSHSRPRAAAALQPGPVLL